MMMMMMMMEGQLLAYGTDILKLRRGRHAQKKIL
jgi:hypothetical protein